MKRRHELFDDRILPIPIREDVTVLLANLPRDLRPSEADKIARVARALADHEQNDRETVAVPIDALRWLFGLGDSFERPEGMKGNFWWRTEFRRRAGLVLPAAEGS